VKQQRLRRLERIVREADAGPALRPGDVARELAIAQVAEEGFRAAWEQGGPVREAIADAYTRASAQLERENPTPERTADAQYWRDYQAASELERLERQQQAAQCGCGSTPEM
jgi:hypothetical protein